LLPWAGALRLAVACWMYSNEEIFPYSKLNIGKLPWPQHFLSFFQLFSLISQLMCKVIRCLTPQRCLILITLGSRIMLVFNTSSSIQVYLPLHSSTFTQRRPAIGTRIPRGNVFPLFVFLVIVLVFLAITQLYSPFHLTLTHSNLSLSLSVSLVGSNILPSIMSIVVSCSSLAAGLITRKILPQGSCLVSIS
jgi:hypothetical protein